MNLDQDIALLGGLSPSAFMQLHWQKKPLLVRQALPGAGALLQAEEVFGLAAHEDVESRLLQRSAGDWQLQHGPFEPGHLPQRQQANWTLLVQGLDLHHDAAHQLMQRFRFVPDARLDDVMVSFATDGGGVGPHFDEYDVFLLQVAGQRRWRIGRQQDLTLQPGLPLRILQHFEPEQDYVLDPGDMLYLPPMWAHDGVAVGECMTCSIGFRRPDKADLAAALLARMAEHAADELADEAYADADQPATAEPGRIPAQMLAFASRAVRAAIGAGGSAGQALGEWLTEPKFNVWFEAGGPGDPEASWVLDRRSRVNYSDGWFFINGESYRLAGPDEALLRGLANARRISPAERAGLSAAARAVLGEWQEAGWLHDERD